MRIKTLAVASAAGGRHRGGREAAHCYYEHCLKQRPFFSCGIRHSSSHRHYKLRRLFRQLHHATQNCVRSKQPFLVVEGDHSSAMGTWSGVMDGLEADQSLGLIWIDAHMDANTFQSSPTGNVHGMPVAALLDSKDRRLQKLYPGKKHLDPKNLILIGLRSYETGEKALLDSLGVEYYTVDSLKATGSLETILRRSVKRLEERCSQIGMSIDMDAIDPRDAPAVATPVAQGLRGRELVQAISKALQNITLCGLEISEYVPEIDPDQRTVRLISQLIKAVYPSSENRFLGSFNSGIKSISLPS